MNNDRQIGGLNLFLLWFGAAVSLAEIMTGSLIAPLGVKTGITVIIVGHLIGALILSFTGVIGFKEKKPSLISSRSSLGQYGSYIISLFNIIQLIGWTAIMLIQGARAMQSITGNMIGFSTLAVLIGLMVCLWALSREQGISFINNLAVVLLLLLSLVMLKAILAGGEAKSIAGTMSIGLALELSIIMPLSWVPLISDYTMSGKSLKGSFFGSFAGYFLGSSFMYILGLLFAVYTGLTDPMGNLGSLHIGYAALLIILLSTVTTTFMDVYSAVMSTLNLNEKLSRRKLIILFSALGTLLAIFFPMEQYENFLYMIGSLFAPTFAVIIANYFILKKDLSGKLFNIPGLIAIICGIITYYAIISLDFILGSTIPAMIITMAVYMLLSKIFEYYGSVNSTKAVIKG
ncbi:putative hydroxymethylpyrimidine transporter CytX [Syntrophomonas erecta]